MFARAFAEDRIVVTSNCDDFAKLACANTVHVGLVFFEDGGLLRDEQLRLVREGLRHLADEIAAGRDLVNRVLRNLVGLDVCVRAVALICVLRDDIA